MSTRPAAPLALYVHVPFCLSVCPYCEFVVYAGAAARGPRSQVGAFLDALHAELDLRADAATGVGGGPPEPLQSVYLGGGTPSLLAAADVARLLDHVERRFGIAHGAEITLEANPGPADRGDLAGFRAAGVTRLSIGAQSLVGSELRTLGRRHAPVDVAETVRLARSAGFASLSIDLLEDVPGQTLASWGKTLGAAVQLDLDHISTYALTVDLDDPITPDRLPASPGASAWRRRAAAAQDEDRAADMDARADDVLGAAGYRRYEIANRARAGHESRHNLAYWRRLPYEALGPGAHAFDGDRIRRWNDADLGGYLGALAPAVGRPALPPGGFERLSPAIARAERLILGLRLDEGVPETALRERGFTAGLRWGLERGLAVQRGGRLCLTPRGRLLSNELFERLLPEAAVAA